MSPDTLAREENLIFLFGTCRVRKQTVYRNLILFLFYCFEKNLLVSVKLKWFDLVYVSQQKHFSLIFISGYFFCHAFLIFMSSLMCTVTMVTGVAHTQCPCYSAPQ